MVLFAVCPFLHGPYLRCLNSGQGAVPLIPLPFSSVYNDVPTRSDVSSVRQVHGKGAMTHRIRISRSRTGSLATVIMFTLFVTACGGGSGGEANDTGNVGTASLSWTPPTTNTDGTTLLDLAGYNIYYGMVNGSYPNKVVVNTFGVSSYLIENLASGTHFFVIRAYDNSGNESADSNVASKTVQ